MEDAVVRAGRRVLVLVTVTVLGTGVPAAAGSGAAQAAPGMDWAASAGSVPSIGGQLNGVSADSATDVWAVGFSETNPNPRQPLIVHWDGTAWSQVKSPTPGTGSNGTVLTSVSAVSPTDAWAVGFSSNSANLPQPFILHWDGTAWSRVPGPSPGARGVLLTSVSAVSPTDAWAVGTFTTIFRVPKPLIVHWNGTAWSRVPSPNPGAGVNSLSGVSALSATNAWAVGTYVVKGPVFKSLTLHWNGTAWSHVPSPNPGNFAQLTGVSALSHTSAWAVGISFGPDNLALHWNGTAWSQASVPSPGSTANKQLSGVSAVSATDAWAVGYGQRNSRFQPFFPVIVHWDGTAWSRVKSPNPGCGGGDGCLSQLFAVDALSPANAWAVGGGGVILIEHWNGTAWSAG